MSDSRFDYSIFIRTTPEKLWEAITNSEFTRRFWCEVTIESDWKKGSSWRMLAPDGRVADHGEIIEIDPPSRLVLSWQQGLVPDLRAEGFSRAVFQFTPVADCVNLTVTHSIGHENSLLIAAFASGWPPLLSSLKSLLETGEPLAMTSRWPQGM